MIRCKHCGFEIEYIHAPVFNRDGSDSDMSFDVIEPEEAEGEVACIELPKSWCGYELSEEEMMDSIRCPNCGRFPFSESAGINVDVVVRVVCFAENKGVTNNG